MESPKKLVCSSSARLPYQEALKVQAWSEDIQRVKGNCLSDGYMSSLPEEVHVDLSQNKLTELAGLWELVSGPNKRKFYDLYGQIASCRHLVLFGLLWIKFAEEEKNLLRRGKKWFKTTFEEVIFFLSTSGLFSTY